MTSFRASFRASDPIEILDEYDSQRIDHLRLNGWISELPGDGTCSECECPIAQSGADAISQAGAAGVITPIFDSGVTSSDDSSVVGDGG